LSFVLDSITIIAFVAFALIYFIGLGWLMDFWLRRQKSLSITIEQFPLRLAVLILSGIVLNFGVTLIIQHVKTALWVSGILSLAGWMLLFLTNRKYIQPKALLTKLCQPEWWLLAAFLTGLYLLLIIGTPLFEWDARSIWFLHGKMIYLSQTVGVEAGWQHPSIQFSHVDYPKLIPLMAAQVASLFGYWNEYLPKISLIFLFVPVIVSMISFLYQNKTYILFVIPVVLIGNWLWNGYMDGYLALYFGMAILSAYHFIITRNSLYFLAGLAFLATCLYLKNEGQLALVVTIMVFSFSVLLRKDRFSLVKSIQFGKSLILKSSILFLPFIVWSYYKFAFNLKNDLQLGSEGFFRRIIERISDQSFILISQNLGEQINLSLTIFLLLLITLYLLNKSYHAPLFFLATAMMYSFGILMIYLSTPFDLNYHLRTSVDRTMLPVNTVLWFGALAIIQKLDILRKSEK